MNLISIIIMVMPIWVFANQSENIVKNKSFLVNSEDSVSRLELYLKEVGLKSEDFSNLKLGCVSEEDEDKPLKGFSGMTRRTIETLDFKVPAGVDISFCEGRIEAVYANASIKVRIWNRDCHGTFKIDEPGSDNPQFKCSIWGRQTFNGVSLPDGTIVTFTKGGSAFLMQKGFSQKIKGKNYEDGTSYRLINSTIEKME